MKKFIVVLFVLMLSNSALAMGEMGKGECIYSDNGPRVTEVSEEAVVKEVETTDSESQSISQ
jgi:hypothetical protein